MQELRLRGCPAQGPAGTKSLEEEEEEGLNPLSPAVVYQLSPASQSLRWEWVFLLFSREALAWQRGEPRAGDFPGSQGVLLMGIREVCPALLHREC